MTFMQAQQISEHAVISAYMDTNVRSLELLRDIEKTCVAVRTTKDTLTKFVELVRSLSESLSAIDVVVPEDKILESLDSVESQLEMMNIRFNTCLVSAKNDPDLTYEDGVEVIYAEAQHALCDLHEAVQEYKWSLLQHNAEFDISDAGPELASADEINAYLAAL